MVEVPLGAQRTAILGSAERNLKMIREAFGVTVSARDGLVKLSGPQEGVFAARRVLDTLGKAVSEDRADSPREMTRERVLELITDVAAQTRLIGNGEGAQTSLYAGGRAVRPKSPNQAAYLDAIREKDLVFAVGPAGTGKTYLAVAAAMHLLGTDRVRKLILVRPAVEAGEKLGFLPGDLQQKVNPYLRPLFDALNDLMDFATIKRFMESDVVEVAPLAFMRGRTLNHAVIILDEAQNTTRGQMKMFLTRMGQGSKTIVTGDVTQIDLPDPRESGLIDAARRLRRIPGAAFVQLTEGDVVRHTLVQRIVEAYGDESGGRTADKEDVGGVGG
jgi:phosphate starvation-inducible protein PhoH and related proteins